MILYFLSFARASSRICLRLEDVVLSLVGSQNGMFRGGRMCLQLHALFVGGVHLFSQLGDGLIDSDDHSDFLEGLRNRLC